jgi:hypothetical protein
MKYSKVILALGVFFCLVVGRSDEDLKPELPQVRKEHKEKHDNEGNVIAYIDTVYRGNERVKNERILQTVRSRRKVDGDWVMARTFYLDGQMIMTEVDEGNGTTSVICFLKDNKIFEAFRRQTDGTVEPVPSVELAKLKNDQQAFVEGLGLVMDNVRNSLATNSVEKVLQDLKANIHKHQQDQNEAESSGKK